MIHHPFVAFRYLGVALVISQLVVRPFHLAVLVFGIGLMGASTVVYVDEPPRSERIARLERWHDTVDALSAVRDYDTAVREADRLAS